jgi:hypothetical protein
MAILQAAVSHNKPVRMTASISGTGGPALISAYYSNLEKPQENGWVDQNQPTIDRWLVFDEQGFHRVRFGAAGVGAGVGTILGLALADAAGAIQLYDAATNIASSGQVAFAGPAVEVELRLYSY